MKRLAFITRMVDAGSGMMPVIGIVLSCAAGFAVIAAMTLTSIASVSLAHDGARRLEQARTALEAADEAAHSAAATVAGTLAAIASGNAENFSPAAMDAPAIAALRQSPAQGPRADALIGALQGEHALLQTALDLAHQGLRSDALAILAGHDFQARQQGVWAAQTALRDESWSALRRWSTEEAGWRVRSFWTALLACVGGLLAVLCVSVAFLYGLEKQRMLERRLARTQAALARSERVRNSFLQVVGHDLRQPLQAIGLFTAGLERWTASEDSRQLLDGLRSATGSMARMLTGLLDVSRLDAGAVAMEKIPVRLEPVLAPIRAEFSTIALARGIELLIPPSALVVHTDPIMLESILRNLVSNAVRYTRRGRVAVTCHAEGSHATIRVEDTGQGIPAEDFDNIFLDFYRVPGTSRSEEGLGLGLGIVRRMARLLDIGVTLSSTMGKGTIFTLALELSDALPVQAPAPARALEAPEFLLAGRRVLLVEDEESVRHALRAELQAQGMLVTVAPDPQATCALFTGEGRQAFDIILVDHDLRSTMTGPELLDHLAVHHQVMLPGLVITGTMDFTVIQELQDADYPWLAKPVSTPVLVREMQRLLSPKPVEISAPA